MFKGLENFLLYLDLPDGLLSGHLEGVSVLGTHEELHLDAGRERERR